MRLARIGALAFAAAGIGCSFMQPASPRAPIADTVGAVVMTGCAAIAVAEMHPAPSTGLPDFTADGGLTAGAGVLAGLGVVYAISAIYGFSHDRHDDDRPVIGLQILSLGLSGFVAGANSTRSNEGCCSYHGGVGTGCLGDKLACEDGTPSPTCECR